MNLGYFTADTLGVTLYATKEGLKAHEVHRVKFGSWKLDLSIEVDPDVASGREYGFWVTLNKTLRLYLIVREKESWLFVLNTEALEKAGAATGFIGQTTKERVVEFKSAIKGVFRYTASGWNQVQYKEGSAGA